MNDSILNIGAGKVNDDDFDDFDIIVNVDGSYPDLEEFSLDYVTTSFLKEFNEKVSFCKSDIFEFLYSFPYKFSHVNADRIFEHMFYDAGQVGQLLDACNQITHDDGSMTIVVPNHAWLAEVLLNYERNEQSTFIDNKGEEVTLDFSKDAIKLMLNTEFCNSRCDPHGSIWTPRTAREFIEAEGGTWKIVEINEHYHLKGRPCYMKIELSKE